MTPIESRIRGAVGGGARAAMAAAQQALPDVMRDVQSLLSMQPIAARPAGGLASGAIPMLDITREPLPLLGGLTLERVRQMHEQVRDARLARKNLWYIRVTDPNPPNQSTGPQPSVGGVIDMLAVDVSYSPFTLSGEKINVGSAVMDRLNGSESVDLSLTTMDDEAGTIKRWFEGKCLQAAHPGGTFGLPSEYCVNIQVVHAVSAEDAPVKTPPYKNMVTMRPQAIQFEMSRRDPALQELTLSFTEFDTFISAIGGIL